MRNAAVRELTWACCIKRLWPPSQKADPALPEPAPPAAHLNVALLSSAEGGAGPGADILPPVPEPSQSEPKVPPKPPGRTIGAWLQPGAFSRSLFNSFIYSFSRMRTAFESTPCMLVCVCEKQHTFFFKACTVLHDSCYWLKTLWIYLYSDWWRVSSRLCFFSSHSDFET